MPQRHPSYNEPQHPDPRGTTWLRPDRGAAESLTGEMKTLGMLLDGETRTRHPGEAGRHFVQEDPTLHGVVDCSQTLYDRELTRARRSHSAATILGQF
jgi:hypothetical protein